MAYDPRLGYDPAQYSPQGAAAQTLQQWVSDMASQYTMAYANGNTDAFPANAFSDEFWATLGLPPLPDESWGATARNPNAVINPGVYSGLAMFFNQLATNPESAARAGITVPQLPDAGQVTDDLGRSQIYDATQRGLDRQHDLDILGAQTAAAAARDAANNAWQSGENEKDRVQAMAIANLQEAGLNARQANELASRMSIAQLQEAAESQRNADRIASQEKIAAMQDATQREGIASNERISAADRTSREGIATADRTSRESIATADRLESARQFDLGQAEDRRQFNSTMLFNLFDRGIELMKNPVDWLAMQYYMENLSIPLTALNYSSVASFSGSVPQTGPSQVGPMTGGPAIMDGDFAAAAAVGVQPQFVPLDQALQANPGQTNNPVTANYTAAASSQQWGDLQQIQTQLQATQAQGLQQAGASQNAATQQVYSQALAAGPQGSGTPGTAGVEGRSPTSPASLSPAPPSMGTTNTPGSTPGGINIQSLNANAGGGTAPQGSTAPTEQLIRQLADQMGIPFDQLWKLSNAGALTPAYNRDAIANSPVIQTLKNGGDAMSQFRTAAAQPTASPNAQMTGPGLGLRGGQDINANLLVNNSEANKGMIQGAVMADGFYWPDVQRQAFKASPITAYDVASRGKRR